ncbi:MAG: ABC transporter ATP-binding protein [Christensenellaceae bacterium]|nr:ABC transporter ATP-binding protein [Christensenellaceae bacterium]
MLKIESIVVNYGNFQALNGISMEVWEGEIVALLGSNGAGKSTTINAISGVVPVKSGDILFNGESLSGVPAHVRVMKGIVQVPEGRKLFPAMTVFDNLLIGSYLPQARKVRKESLEMVLDLFPKMADRRDQLAGSLSGGEQQMCAIGRAMMAKPRLLMLDEPSLGLAPVIVDAVFDALVRVKKMGVTILLVEQNVLASLDIADRGYVIEVGSNVVSGSSAELSDNEEVSRAYLGI